MLDWTINVGHLLTAVGMALGAAGVVWAVRSDVRVLTTRVISIEAQLLKMADVLVHIGRQDERLNSHERRLDRIEDDK